jgi:cytoskeleton protein RodZ
MADFGGQLKAAREQRGVTLRQIATATKISMTVLEALERSDFSRLPGGIFSRAFVRAYAIQVGLDPEQTVLEFLVEYELNDNADAEKALPEVTADDRAFLERQRRAAWWLRTGSVALLLIVASALVAWQVRSRAKSTADDQPAESGSHVAPAPPVPVSSAPVVEPLSSNPAGTPVAPREGGSFPGARTASAPPAPAATPPPNDDEVALRLHATTDCWARVTVDGAVIFEETLKAGATRDIKPGRDVYLQVGNAGALTWSINGQSAKPLGKPGQLAAVRVTRATFAKHLQ